MRVVAGKAGHFCSPDFIEKVALACLEKEAGEDLHRAFYYDCKPFNGAAKLPISGAEKVFSRDGGWLDKLAERDFFAVRLGVLKFRGFKPKKSAQGKSALTDEDFDPSFEQKGVDMRIGLDIATLSHARAVSRIAVVTNDTDCIPAFKFGRKAGMQIVLVQLPGGRLAPELRHHADICRLINWPSMG